MNPLFSTTLYIALYSALVYSGN